MFVRDFARTYAESEGSVRMVCIACLQCPSLSKSLCVKSGAPVIATDDTDGKIACSVRRKVQAVRCEIIGSASYAPFYAHSSALLHIVYAIEAKHIRAMSI